MRNLFLVADSGGTQTDWCFVSETGVREYFTTKSFHPSNWNEDFFKELENFPESNHDDIVDALSGAFLMHTENKYNLSALSNM